MMPGLLLDQAPPSPMAMAPPPSRPRKPSILDRLLGRLFPQGASPYGGLLTPEQLSGARRSALLRMAGTLFAEGGPKPQGTSGPLEGVGKALMAANWPEALSQAGQEAGQVNELQGQMGRRRAIEGIVQKYPPQPNETPQQAVARINQMLGDITRVGGPEAEQVAQLLSQQIRGQATAHEIGKPEPPKIPPTQLLTNVWGRLGKWEPIRSAVAQYEQFRNKPPTDPNTATLLAAAATLTNVHSQFFTEGESGLAKLPEIGHLIALLQSLAGHEKLTKEQRDELVSTTDAIVERLAGEAQNDRAEAERQLRDAGMTDVEIRTYLQVFRPFGRRRDRTDRALDDAGWPR